MQDKKFNIEFAAEVALNHFQGFVTRLNADLEHQKHDLDFYTNRIVEVLNQLEGDNENKFTQYDVDYYTQQVQKSIVYQELLRKLMDNLYKLSVSDILKGLPKNFEIDYHESITNDPA